MINEGTLTNAFVDSSSPSVLSVSSVAIFDFFAGHYRLRGFDGRFGWRFVRSAFPAKFAFHPLRMAIEPGGGIAERGTELAARAIVVHRPQLFEHLSRHLQQAFSLRLGHVVLQELRKILAGQRPQPAPGMRGIEAVNRHVHPAVQHVLAGSPLAFGQFLPPAARVRPPISAGSMLCSDAPPFERRSRSIAKAA